MLTDSTRQNKQRLQLCQAVRLVDERVLVVNGRPRAVRSLPSFQGGYVVPHDEYKSTPPSLDVPSTLVLPIVPSHTDVANGWIMWGRRKAEADFYPKMCSLD
jgi:hypothetical protein